MTPYSPNEELFHTQFWVFSIVYEDESLLGQDTMPIGNF